jgi:serine/threonine protein kinase
VADADLKTMLQKQQFDSEELALLASSFGCLCSAVTYLHEQKCRHKDIKPGNILVHNGTVLLTDFGIALDWSERGRDTTTGNVQSYTNAYAAPEVALAKPRNSSSDIWSLGCVFLDILVSRWLSVSSASKVMAC